MVMECIDRGIVVRISNLVIDVDVDAVGRRFNEASGYDSNEEKRLVAMVSLCVLLVSLCVLLVSDLGCISLICRYYL